MINFLETQAALELYLAKINQIGEELRALREEHLQADLALMEAEESGRARADEQDMNVTRSKEFVKTFSHREAKEEKRKKSQLRSKEEELSLTLEGLNLLKTQIRLKELELRLEKNNI